MNKILLANDLLPQPVFQVCEKLVIHRSDLYDYGVRNSVISDHYKACLFKNLPLCEKSSGDRSETRQFIACQGVCKALSPIVSTLMPTF
jgi:hypothetical protein